CQDGPVFHQRNWSTLPSADLAQRRPGPAPTWPRTTWPRTTWPGPWPIEFVRTVQPTTSRPEVTGSPVLARSQHRPPRGAARSRQRLASLVARRSGGRQLTRRGRRLARASWAGASDFGRGAHFLESHGDPGVPSVVAGGGLAREKWQTALPG